MITKNKYINIKNIVNIKIPPRGGGRDKNDIIIINTNYIILIIL